MNGGLPLGMIAQALTNERQRVGWSMGELAKRAGVAKSTLSQLEAATGNPSLETLWALATALSIPLAQLLAPTVSDVTVIRAGEGPAMAAEAGDYAATLLSAAPPRTRRDIYRITAEPGQVKESAPHQSGTIEHIYCCSGAAKAGPQGAEVTLAEGDFMSYPGDVVHTFEALAPHTHVVLITEMR